MIESCLKELLVEGIICHDEKEHKHHFLNDGLSLDEIAVIIKVHVQTVGSTRTAWLTDGINSMADSARTGSPRKSESGEIYRLDVLTG